MSSSAEHSFQIRTAEDFFRKLTEEYRDWQSDQLSSRHAINFALTAWHLREWLWGSTLKNDFSEQKRLFGSIFKSFDEFDQRLTQACPELIFMQDVCNGSKHFRTDGEVANTSTKVDFSNSSTWGMASWGRMQWGGGVTCFLALTTNSGHVVDFATVATKVHEFWSSIFPSNPI